MKLQNSYNKITKVEVHDLCNQLETRLPDEYIDFLLLYNGGQAEKNRYTKIGATGEIYFDFYVNVFYGI